MTARLAHRVPTEPLRKLVVSYRLESECKDEEIAEDFGISIQSMRDIVNLRYDTIDFDRADRIVTKVNVFAWFKPPLDQFYWPPGERPDDMMKPVKCARRNCSNWFEVPPVRAGKQMFCNKNCKDQEGRYRLGKTTPVDQMCRHGHPRTPENTRIARDRRTRSGWTKECKDCERISQRKRTTKARRLRRRNEARRKNGNR